MSPILYWVKASSKDTGIRTARCFQGFASSMLTITLQHFESYMLLFFLNYYLPMFETGCFKNCFDYVTITTTT